MANFSKCKEVWGMSFFSVLWHIWEARNKSAFSNKETSLSHILDLVKFKTGCWIKAFFSSCSSSLLDFNVDMFSISMSHSHHMYENLLSWCAPAHGALKFNVDGSAMGKSGLAGIGGLLRNSVGVVLAIFSISVGVLDLNVAEVIAIRKTYIMVKENEELRSVNITIESDSLNAVSWVNPPYQRPWRLLHTSTNMGFRHTCCFLNGHTVRYLCD